MSAARRSTTGCSSCKTRRKKCDEGKPRCQRCVNSGSHCSYDFVQYPDHQSHRKQRTKPAPRATAERATRGSRSDPAGHFGGSVPPPSLASPSDSIGFIHPILSESWGSIIYPNSNYPTPSVPWGDVDSVSVSLSASFSVPSPLSPFDAFGSSQSSNSSPDLEYSPSGVPATCDMYTMASGSMSQGSAYIEEVVEEDEREAEGDDIEGVQGLICTAPNLDSNVRENTLPFVLHCYSQWTITRIFEPLAIADSVRNQVWHQFSNEGTRKKTILIANVMITFAKNLTIDSARMSILNHLVSEVRQASSRFIATPIAVPAADREHAMRTLDSIFEILTLQTHTQPTAACIRTLDYAAPIFRRACLEPPGKPINLPNLLLEPSLNLRHFASVDVMQSVTTGRPTYFQYEVPFSLELCEQMYQLQDNGSQWLYGLPDQFILLIAWINSMAEKPGEDHSEAVAWIEKNLSKIKIATNESGDALLRIGRMVVLECWRCIVHIYLYMMLCKANTRDPRVIRAHKGFMRLVRGVKPGRIPDAFLVCPFTVAGVCAFDERDRATLRHRILNVRECSETGTAVSEVILELEDVWSRTRDRPAVWSDWRTAVFNVTGR